MLFHSVAFHSYYRTYHRLLLRLLLLRPHPILLLPRRPPLTLLPRTSCLYRPNLQKKPLFFLIYQTLQLWPDSFCFGFSFGSNRCDYGTLRRKKIAEVRSLVLKRLVPPEGCGESHEIWSFSYCSFKRCSGRTPQSSQIARDIVTCNSENFVPTKL
jgi:hypothetical protein